MLTYRWRMLARTGHPHVDPRAAARDDAIARCRDACLAGDHDAEREIASWRVSVELDVDPVARADAWSRLLDAMDHSAMDAAARHERALAAHDDLVARLADAGAARAAARNVLEPFARRVATLERQLGAAPSPAAAELAARDRSRAARTANGPAFGARHAEDLAALRTAMAPGWYEARFLDRHGVRPPAGWWIDATGETAEAAGDRGGHVAPFAASLFDAEDHVAFLEETEAAFRVDRGLPARGEGWVSATSLARCVGDVLPDVELVREARPAWLGRQRLDIFLPALGVAIEYQGEQHYQPVEHWGGDDGLAARRELDERKRDACARAGIRLIEWRYDEPISVERVRRRLQDAGVVPLD
jgi:hypothetical protein